jgi:hypothetical protein
MTFTSPDKFSGGDALRDVIDLTDLEDYVCGSSCTSNGRIDQVASGLARTASTRRSRTLGSRPIPERGDLEFEQDTSRHSKGDLGGVIAFIISSCLPRISYLG